MTPRFKQVIAGALLLLGATVFFAKPAPASAELSFQSMLNSIAGNVNSILTITKAQNVPDQAQRELAARKDTIGRVLDLTLAEQNDLSSRLAQLQDLSPAETAMRDRLSGLLTENENSFAQIRTRLDEARSIDSVKQLAEDFKNWRSASYNPKISNIAAFTFVYQENPVITTANTRLSKISANIALRPLGTVKNAADMILGHATRDIQNASDLHQQAKTLIMVALADKLATTTSSTIDPKSDSDTQRNLSDAKKFTQQSYGAIADAYQLFIQLSALIMR